jgi:hypothetical protein
VKFGLLLVPELGTKLCYMICVVSRVLVILVNKPPRYVRTETECYCIFKQESIES